MARGDILDLHRSNTRSLKVLEVRLTKIILWYVRAGRRFGKQKKQDMHTYTYNEILTTKTARLKC